MTSPRQQKKKRFRLKPAERLKQERVRKLIREYAPDTAQDVAEEYGLDGFQQLDVECSLELMLGNFARDVREIFSPSRNPNRRRHNGPVTPEEVAD